MFDRLKRLYNSPEGKLTQEELHRAVDKGWITEEQYVQIITDNEDATVLDFEGALTELGVR